MDDVSCSASIRSPARRGVVAVIEREGKLLAIRRSQSVVAPGKICFPGGGLEAGEDAEAALRREVREELGVDVTPVRKLWESTTPWNVHLEWWLAHLDAAAELKLNTAEVESFSWLSCSEMRQLAELLESNHPFLAAVDCGQIVLLPCTSES